MLKLIEVDKVKMLKNILLLSDKSATLSEAGGKGKNLIELIGWGLKVPEGFIISTNVYDLFIEQNHIRERTLELAKNINEENSGDFEKASEKISRLFENGEMPFIAAGEILNSYRKLGDKYQVYEIPVAVRSSATAEDLPEHAFAGQQDTFLNIIGSEQLIVAVKKCWASLWTARAISYRMHNQISHDNVKLAVVIQTMVDAECSGVVFTANPYSGHRKEIVINSGFGLGEAVVSGAVNPDEYIVRSDSQEIIKKKIAIKNLMIVPEEKGGTKQIDNLNNPEQVLNDEQIISLSKLADLIAKRFETPQDIEWSLTEGELFILQSRQITSLYPLPENSNESGGLQIYVNFNSIQGLTAPLTPLGIDVLRDIFSGIRNLLRLQTPMKDLLPDAGGRLFIKLTDPIKSPKLRRLVLSQLADVEPGAKEIILELIREGRIESKPAISIIKGLILILLKLPLAWRILHALILPEKIYPLAVKMGDEFIQTVKAQISKSSDLLLKLNLMRTHLQKIDNISFRFMPAALPAYGLLSIIDKWLVNWIGEPKGSSLKLLRGLPNNITSEMNIKLWNIANKINNDIKIYDEIKSEQIDILVEKFNQGVLPNYVQTLMVEFFKKYGMRCVGEIDIGKPRWREDHSSIFKILQSYLRYNHSNNNAGDIFQRNQNSVEEFIVDYINRIRKTRFGIFRAKVFKLAIKRIRSLAGLREIPLYYLVSIVNIYRGILIEVSNELVRQGILTTKEDIFYLPVEILKQFAETEHYTSNNNDLNLKEVVSNNRKKYERELLRSQIPSVLLSTGEAFYKPFSDKLNNSDSLLGEAVSPGVVEGTVHVVLNPSEADLRPGEILVCPSTDPGWTPLFLTASGLIMEIGGMMTHGSIVAREYGLPAVVAVPSATTFLHTGQYVRLDANTGVIHILNKHPRSKDIKETV